MHGGDHLPNLGMLLGKVNRRMERSTAGTESDMHLRNKELLHDITSDLPAKPLLLVYFASDYRSQSFRTHPFGNRLPQPLKRPGSRVSHSVMRTERNATLEISAKLKSKEYQ